MVKWWELNTIINIEEINEHNKQQNIAMTITIITRNHNMGMFHWSIHRTQPTYKRGEKREVIRKRGSIRCSESALHFQNIFADLKSRKKMLKERKAIRRKHTKIVLKINYMKNTGIRS